MYIYPHTLLKKKAFNFVVYPNICLFRKVFTQPPPTHPPNWLEIHKTFLYKILEQTIKFFQKNPTAIFIQIYWIYINFGKMYTFKY